LDRAVSMAVIFAFGFIYSKLLIKKVDPDPEGRSGKTDVH
jgi:hypothetical protein